MKYSFDDIINNMDCIVRVNHEFLKRQKFQNKDDYDHFHQKKNLNTIEKYKNYILSKFKIDFQLFSDDQLQKCIEKNVYDGKLYFLKNKIFIQKLNENPQNELMTWNIKPHQNYILINKIFQLNFFKYLEIHFKSFFNHNSKYWFDTITLLEQMFFDQMINKSSSFSIFDFYFDNDKNE